MSNITYHKATQDDIETLVENRIQFTIEFAGEQPDEKIFALRKQMNAYFTKAKAENSCISFIAKCDGIIAGIGSVHLREMPGNATNPSGKWGYIMNMYTRPAYRRKGICTGILNALTEEAGKYGITAFELHATNTGELVYAQNGFKIHREPTYRKFLADTTNE